MNKKGFTLIELLITIAIIGILSAIGIPAYIGQQKNAARTEAFTNLQNLALLEQQRFSDGGMYSPANCVLKAGAPICYDPIIGCPSCNPVVAPVGLLTLGVAGKDHTTNAYDTADSLGRGLIQRGGAAVNATDPTVAPSLLNALTGFKPGTGTTFSYWIVNGQRITLPITTPFTVTNIAATDPPCYVAFAQGNTAGRNKGETFAIDCNNNKNF